MHIASRQKQQANLAWFAKTWLTFFLGFLERHHTTVFSRYFNRDSNSPFVKGLTANASILMYLQFYLGYSPVLLPKLWEA